MAFKIGDKVIYEGKPAIVAGLHGTYVSIERSDGIGWKSDGDIDASYTSSLSNCYWNVHIEEIQKVDTCKFKVGDMVRCINKNANLSSELEIGKCYLVTRVSKDKEEYLLSLHNIDSRWSDYQFELVEEESTQLGTYTYSTSFYADFPATEEPKKTLMQKLTTTLKRVLNSNMQALYKAGYINGDLELTDTGRRALNTLMLELHEEALAKMAQEDLKEMEKEQE